MAHVLHHIATASAPQPLIGRQLFDVITAGMYDNPLMIYREYVQNAVDSIDLAVDRGAMTIEQGCVQITIERHRRSIIIEDNGLGLTNLEAHQTLVSLGCSPKGDTRQRGFRGIGRLGGLAYCRKLIFETRSGGHEHVAVVTWDHKRLEQLSNEKRRVGLEETLERVAQCDIRPARENEPLHFFRVTLLDVTDFHNDALVSPNKVRDYLAQVAPVPFNAEGFSFSGEIETWLNAISGYRCYNIHLNDQRVERPYSDIIEFSVQRCDRIHRVERFEFKTSDGKLLALGWYAQSGFLAALPEKSNVRGLRVRLGNIEVGDKHMLTQYFTESRFAGWHLGEIHVVDHRLKPNARRDGFEHNTELERFIEQATFLCRYLSGLCRKSSIRRAKREKVARSLTKLEAICKEGVTFIDKAHYRRSMDKTESDLRAIERDLCSLEEEGVLEQRLEAVRNSLTNDFTPTFLEDLYDGRSVGDDISGLKKAETLAQVAHLILEEFDRCNSATDLLNVLLSKYVVNQKKGAIKIVSV